MKLEEKLLKLRKEFGLSQEELGDKIDVSRQAVSKWENGETKPDIDKLKLIAEIYNVSYDYLLNDDIDNKVEKNVENKKKENMFKKIIKTIWFKIIFFIFIIYLLFSIYKLINFCRFYLIANSFSEENYSMSLSQKVVNENSDNFNMLFSYTRIGDELLYTTYYYDDKYNSYSQKEDGTSLPTSVEYTNFATHEKVILNYNTSLGKYVKDEYADSVTDKEIDELNYNIVKMNATENIKILIKCCTFNPFCYYVSPITNTVVTYSPSELVTSRITFNNVGVLGRTSIISKNMYSVDCNYSYDYVQDHFKDKKIENPLETYKDLILKEE